MARHIKIEKDKDNNAIDLYKMVLQATPNGMTLDEMKNRLSIMEKMDKANDNLVLEDVEWDILSQAVNSYSWNQVHAFIPLACDAVLNAEKKDAK